MATISASGQKSQKKRKRSQKKKKTAAQGHSDYKRLNRKRRLKLKNKGNFIFKWHSELIKLSPYLRKPFMQPYYAQTSSSLYPPARFLPYIRCYTVFTSAFVLAIAIFSVS